MPGPVLQGLIALAIYVVVYLVAFGQALVSHLSVPAVGQNEVDPNFYIWAWRWWTYAVSHWTNPLYSYQIGAPAGYNLAWATTSPSIALFMAPITATLGPVVSFNLTLLLAPPTAAWATFVAARRLTGRFWASLPAGCVFGFNVYTLDHNVSGQPNLTVTLLLPLLLYLVVRWWDGSLGRIGYVIWMMVAIALEFYTFVEAFAELSLIWAFGLVIGFALARRAQRGKVVRLAVLTVISYVGALVLAAPYLLYALKHYPTTLTRQLPQFSLDLSGLVLPRADRLLGMKWWAAAAEHDMAATTYLGIPLLVILVLLVVTSWRSRLVWLLAAGFVVTIALAAGPNLIIDGKQLAVLPWSGIWSLPIFKSAEPVRFVDFAYLALAVVMALWLSALSRNCLVLAGRWLLGLLALAVMFADLPTFAEVVVPSPHHPSWKQAYPALGLPVEIPSFFAASTYRNYLKPGEIVVIVSHRGNAGMLFQATTDFYFRIDGGFINASLSTPAAIPKQVEDMSYPNPVREQQFEDYVRASGIGAIIVEQAWSEKWMYNFADVGMKGISVGGVTLYDTSTMKPLPIKQAGSASSHRG